jgi:hypothetical protein
MEQAGPAVTAPPSPTEAQPEFGAISVGIGVGGETFSISEVEHWVEDGLHMFRSVEFDCFAQHEDEWGAVEAFIQNAEDLFRFLDDLVDAGRATADEVRTLAKLSRRFYEIYNAQRTEILRRKVRLLLRPRDVHSVTWQRRRTPDSSLPPVPV